MTDGVTILYFEQRSESRGAPATAHFHLQTQYMDPHEAVDLPRPTVSRLEC